MQLSHAVGEPLVRRPPKRSAVWRCAEASRVRIPEGVQGT